MTADIAIDRQIRSPHDKSWAVIARAVRREGRSLTRQPLFRRYDSLIEQLTIAGSISPSDPVHRALSAVALVGPFSGADDPDRKSVVADFLVVIAGAESWTNSNVLDLAIAYGVGWGRSIRPGAGWLGRWNGAVQALADLVDGILIDTLSLYRPVFDIAMEADERAGLAAMFALSLTGWCDCDHHVRGCGRRCRRACCFPRHDLSTWNAETVALRSFVAGAVRGLAQREIKGGAFAEGMLCRALAAEGRVLCRSMLMNVCPTCQSKYEGSVCPRGECPRPTGPVRRVEVPNRIVVPIQVAGGRHVEGEYWVCSGCSHLISSKRSSKVAPQCPMCGWMSSAGSPTKSVSVWTTGTPPTNTSEEL